MACLTEREVLALYLPGYGKLRDANVLGWVGVLDLLHGNRHLQVRQLVEEGA